jgi:Peptidase inhibitor family I36
MTRIILLLAAAVLFSISTAPASAAPTCGPGEFCLYYDGLEYNGIYHNSGSDSNLNNDRFEGRNTNHIVGNNTLSAWNRGHSGAVADVLVYTETNGRGARDCIIQNDRGVMPRNWWNSIESYAWVNRATCRANGIIDLKR